MEKEESNLIEKIISLCKRRGFIFPGSEIYGGLAGIYDWGHYGVSLKNNIKNSWWKKFVDQRQDMYGIDASILMRQEVWQKAGHVENFADPLVECLKCKKRWRKDLISDIGKCPDCKGSLSDEKKFNMMFQTRIGAVEDSSAISYLRPETAQGMFVNFKNVVDSFHPKLPFGMAQIGKAFRNEITPRDYIFRLREFEQMEIEYFVKKEEWLKYFEYWKEEMLEWMEEIGLSMDKIHEIEIGDEDRAHYSSRTIDFEFEYPFGQKELFGLAYRTDFDLKNHNLEYVDEENEDTQTKKIFPHVIEPTFGVDRAVLALLTSVYSEDNSGRVFLKFKPHIAPIIVAVSPLLKNKPELVDRAKIVFGLLKEEFGRVAWDDNGNIGKRYRRQDEIGTPWCIVIDFDTLEDESVTIRDRDTGEQTRIDINQLIEYVKERLG